MDKPELATLIETRLLGVDALDQDVVLEDSDWQTIITALRQHNAVQAEGWHKADRKFHPATPLSRLAMALAKAHDRNVSEREKGAATAYGAGSGIAMPYWDALAKTALKFISKRTANATPQDPVSVDRTEKGDVERLTEQLDELQAAETAYRYAHDHYGSADSKTGRAWDLMRRAGDRARAALTEKGGVR